MKTTRRIAAAAFACALASGLHAAPSRATHDHKAPAAPAGARQEEWGIAGDPRAARRTIEVGMTDTMRFTPSKLQVREGETVRFVVVNRGKQPHEFVVGTRKVLDAHAALMRRFPQMDHDEANAVHVPPGRRKALAWTFNRPGEFSFACLIPGHYEGGMTGTVKVMSRKH